MPEAKRPNPKRIEILPAHGVKDGVLSNITAAMSGSYLTTFEAIKPVKGSLKKRTSALERKIGDAVGAVTAGELNFAIKEFGEDAVIAVMDSGKLVIL